MKEKKKIFTNEEAARKGISRQQLALLVKRGELERVARGVYCKPGESAFAQVEVAVLFKRGTDCVIALESALRLHGFTTAMPHAIWIAMRRGARKPAVDFPLEVVRVADDALEYGVQEMTIDGAVIRVYSPAKTVADMFKFRGQVGLDAALEALREGLHMKLFTVDELFAAAEIDRVKRVMRPYVEGVLA